MVIGGYKQGKQQISYNQIDKNGVVLSKMLTKTEIIRHQIHHPENTHNTRFSRQELLDSIEAMMMYIRMRAEAEGLWDAAADY